MADKGKGSFGAQVAALVLILAICVLCFPMPGGGLLITRLSGTEFVPESKPAEAAPVDVPIAAVPLQSTRFAQALDIFPDDSVLMIPADPLDPLASPTRRDWVDVLHEGKTVWVDTQSRMVWGPKLHAELTGMEKEDVDMAKSFCEKETPVGAWVLPTAAEFDIAKINGILKADSGAKHKWLTWEEALAGMVIPSVRGYGPLSSKENYSIRCIARTPHAPADGYMMTDNETTLKAMAE